VSLVLARQLVPLEQPRLALQLAPTYLALQLVPPCLVLQLAPTYLALREPKSVPLALPS
jgi:hypothetical protein